MKITPCFHGMESLGETCFVVCGSTTDEGIRAIPPATINPIADTAPRNHEIAPPFAAAATRNGQATAPTLQQKLSKFSVALRRPGFTCATSRFAAGTARPIPKPDAP